MAKIYWKCFYKWYYPTIFGWAVSKKSQVIIAALVLLTLLLVYPKHLNIDC